MPYIEPDERANLTPKCERACTSGQLNYQITCLISRYVGKDPRYVHINDVLGALEGAKLEFYRRIAAPYEASKMVTNGEVYDRYKK